MILLALALIFLPMIFDGEGSYRPPLNSRIPDPPEIERMPEPVQTRPVIIADTLPDPIPVAEPIPTAVDEDLLTDPANSLQESIADVPNSDTEQMLDQDSSNSGSTDLSIAATADYTPNLMQNSPRLGPDGLPEAWSVRLGIFSNSENASSLLDSLLIADYKAYSSPIPSEQGELTGVFVGPWMNRERVDEYLQKLQTEFQLEGIVVRFRIED